MHRIIPFFLGSALIACSSSDSATLTILTGGETDTFTQAPVPTLLVVDAIQPLGDGGSQTSVLAQATLPATSIDLGTEDESAEAVLTIAGFANVNNDAGVANSEQVLQGQSLLLDFSTLPGTTIPIFVQRKGQFARLPGVLSDSRSSPTLAILQGEYLLVAAGDDSSIASTTQLYDFLPLAPRSTPPTLPRVPMSIAIDGTIAWLIDENGADYFDFSDSVDIPFTLPSGGGSAADIAGGQTLSDENGAQYIIGGTRTTGNPTPWVLKVDPNDTSNVNYPYGNATWHSLMGSRLGAAAAWVTGIGLVVAGGSSSTGAELLTEAALTAGQSTSSILTTVGYLPDSSVGAGATALDSQHVVIAGGVIGGKDAGVRIIDISACANPPMCVPTPWSPLPTAITSAQAFSSNGANVVVVGSEPALASDGSANANAGLTHVYALTNTAASEIPTKVPHMNARAIGSPIGTLLLCGGSGDIESFVP